ncbi:universal stress protein [Yinghuangia soli]|uniref:Universal stress protein n=1 Tax=Yinghuangia soli TaxID=2908204 RepID=A0AA41QBN4_9ACTN|nr:universal stress protein [Yinghuangia soli]MCF2533817.1 universal stress protein [Yinghuangia soli]
MNRQNSGPPLITVGVDGSTNADEALRWAADEAGRRGLALRIVHAWLPLPIPGGRTAGHAESRRILDDAEVRAHAYRQGLDITGVDACDRVGSALATESEGAAMVVLGSRGRGGFRSLLLGSASLTAAATAHCPVVVVRETLPVDEPAAVRDVVVGVDALAPADPVLEFAFEEAAARPDAVLRIIHGRSPETWTSHGDPVFTVAEIEARAARALAEAAAGWSDKYPQVDVVRSASLDAPAAALVAASADAVLTVVGRRASGTSLGLRLGPVAHAVLLHAASPVAVVPF